MFEMKPYEVYIKVNEDNLITSANSSAFLFDLAGWTKIDEGFGDKYHHAQGNYFPKPIMDDRGLYRYKFENNQIIERTQEELDAIEIKIIQTPSQLDIIEAQVTYTAMMTDTLLEG